MREAADAYCRVIEAASSTPREAFVDDAARTLSAAIAAAYQLPEIEPASDDLDEATDTISPRRWLATMKDVSAVLGVWDDYWTTSRVYRLNDMTGLPDLTGAPGNDFALNLSLADALADIWRDLRNGLHLLEEDGRPDDATWEWRFGFRTHWGLHAIEALRALHEQITDARSGEYSA